MSIPLPTRSSRFDTDSIQIKEPSLYIREERKGFDNLFG